MKTILFIDDNISIGKILKLYLETDGNKLVYFENAPAAIDWLNQGNRPTVIITDVYMPLMSGNEFLAYLKNNPLYKDIPVIFLSSEESTRQRISAFKGGAEDYVVKPFNPLELKARLQKYL